MAFDAVDLQVLINLKTNAAGAVEASAAIQGVKQEALAATPAVTNLGVAHKATAAEQTNMEKASRNVSNALGDVESSGGRATRAIGQMGSAMGNFGVGTTAAVAGLLAFGLAVDQSIKNTEASAEATNAVHSALKSVGQDYQTNIDWLNNFISTNARYIDNQYEARQAYALLVRATGDATTAQRAFNDAIDLSFTKDLTGKTIGFQGAVDILSRSLNGQARGLADIGISQKKINELDAESTKAQAALAKAHDEVTKAQDKLESAQEALAKEEDVLHSKRKVSQADLDTLKEKQEAVKTAQDNLTKATDAVTTATKQSDDAAQHHTDVLTQVELKTKGARDAQTELHASQNQLNKDWQDLSTQTGPAFVFLLDQVVAALDTGVQIIENFTHMLDLLNQKFNIIKSVQSFISAVGPSVVATAQNAIARGFGLAEGGIASGPSTGYPMVLHGTEAVLPLNNPARSNQILAAAGYGGGGGGGGVINATFNIANPDPQQTAILVRDQLLRMARTMPSLGLT